MENIQTYIEYFQEQLSQIQAINSHLYRKILYVTLIDCLSRSVYGTRHSNRVRFVMFINECSGWKDRNRVSTPQIALNLEAKNLIYGDLYKEVIRNLESWSPDRIIDTNSDLLIDALRGLASTEEKRVLDKSSYPELLYVYRNKLVHEFREPGYGIEIRGQSTTPYYHSRHIDDSDWSWELVFSSKFFYELCANCIDGCEKLLTVNTLDPYKAYKFGTMWDTE